MVRGLIGVVLFTLYEARRRRVVLAALICATVFIAVVVAGMYFGGPTSSGVGRLSSIRLAMVTVVGLVAANFLAVVITIVLSIDTISGETQSGVMQTLASKPIRRSDILLGKWLAFYIISSMFALLIIGGVLTSAYYLGGFAPPDLALGLLLMLLEIAFVLTLTIAGGTLFGTNVNGIVAFGFFGVAFVGGWIEQLSALIGSTGARLMGVALSLISPGDSMWRLAAFHLQPTMTRDLPANPFLSATLANHWMIAWTAIYVCILLALGLRRFARRSL
jgi:ABC-type transport system involved in multi-copper enzyme maturation permease subunit